MASLLELSKDASEDDEALSSDAIGYAERMSKLRLGEEGVSKVTPTRIYSVACHPTTERIIVAAGDKDGALGLWNVDDQTAENGGVVLYQPHTRTINALEFMPQDSTKLYSVAYDGSVRCLDMVKNSFDFVCSIGSSDCWLQHGKLGAGNTAGSIFLSDSEGRVSLVDLRTKEVSWQTQCHQKKCNTVSLHPLQPEYFVTASLERCCKIWDVRKMGGSKKASPVVTLEDELSVNSAHFSPNGDAILSVSQSHALRLYYGAHQASGIITPAEASCNVRHDNKTGRYLPVFHAAWDPRSDHAFVIGSMTQPRQVEIYSASPPPSGGKAKSKAKCTRIMSLQDPEYLGSVQSRNCFHPRLDVVVCGNASGRMHVFRKP